MNKPALLIVTTFLLLKFMSIPNVHAAAIPSAHFFEEYPFCGSTFAFSLPESESLDQHLEERFPLQKGVTSIELEEISSRLQVVEFVDQLVQATGSQTPAERKSLTETASGFKQFLYAALARGDTLVQGSFAWDPNYVARTVEDVSGYPPMFLVVQKQSFGGNARQKSSQKSGEKSREKSNRRSDRESKKTLFFELGDCDHW